MKNLNKSIPLRPRFTIETNKSIDYLLNNTKKLKSELNNQYKIIILDQQVWIHIKGNDKKYYSPHLQIVFQLKEDGGTHIRALFGPDPTLWTFFMFLHFVVASTFIGFAVVASSHYLLKQSFHFESIMMIIMILIWFLLYFFGRITRSRGTSQMYDLKTVLDKIMQ